MNLNKKITKLRKERNMTQEDLALQLGVSRQSISKWELGVCDPDIQNLKEISKLFGVSFDYLLNDDKEEAAKIAATVVAYPGTSEHQLGYAVDIIDTQLWKLEQEQENLAAQQWLMANSWEYGFILRYPNGKTDSTGIIYEPWHYRYVGPEVARELHESGMTLEEYLLSLSD